MPLKVEDIPEEIINVVDKVNSKLPADTKVVLAGGALRDIVLGKPINDLDIFIFSPNPSVVTKDNLFRQLLAEPVRNIEFIGYMEARGEGCRISRAYTFFDQGYEVNLVVMPYPFTCHSLIADFDFGICQIAFDGSKVMHTVGFQDDVEKKTLTVLNSNHLRECHTKKMQDKFPDHTLVNG